ncbi:MAG: ABC transporter permease [Marmoricola sp.]
MSSSSVLTRDPALSAAKPPRYHRVFGVGREGLIQLGVFVVIVVLVLAPIVPTIYQSLLTRPLYAAHKATTLDNYVRLFTQHDFAKVVLHSLEFAVLTTVIAVVVAVALAVLVVRTRMPGGRVIGSLLLWPLYISPLVLAFGWILMYGPAGFVSVAVKGVIGVVPWNLYTIPGMAVTEAVALVPIAYLYCSGALRLADPSLEDAARTCGAGPLRILRTVVLPLLRPPMIYGALLIFSTSLETLSVPLLYGRPAGINLFASFIYINGLQRSRPDYGLLASASVVTLAFMALLVVLQARLLRNSQRFVAVRGKAARPRQLDLGRLRWVGLAFAWLYLVFGPLLPILGLAARSVTAVFTPLVSPLSVITSSNYATVFSFASFRDSIVNSVIIALVGAVATSFLAAVAVVVARRSGFRLRRPLEVTALSPQVVPGLILGIGFFWAFALVPGLGAITGTLFALIIAFGVRSLPAAFGAIAPLVMQVGQELDDAARSVGADWWRTFSRVLVRLITPAFLAAFVLLFVQMIKEFTPAVFLSSANTQVIGTTMLQLWLNGDTGSVAALAIVQVAITTVFVVLAGVVLKGRTDA